MPKNKLPNTNNASVNLHVPEHPPSIYDPEFWIDTGENKIYLIRAGEFYKIGVSMNPFARMKSMRTACPRKMCMVFAREVSGAIFLELAFHNFHAPTNTYGEWFTDISADKFVSMVVLFEQHISSGGSAEEFSFAGRI